MAHLFSTVKLAWHRCHRMLPSAPFSAVEHDIAHGIWAALSCASRGPLAQARLDMRICLLSPFVCDCVLSSAKLQTWEQRDSVVLAYSAVLCQQNCAVHVLSARWSSHATTARVSGYVSCRTMRVTSERPAGAHAGACVAVMRCVCAFARLKIRYISRDNLAIVIREI